MVILEHEMKSKTDIYENSFKKTTCPSTV